MAVPGDMRSAVLAPDSYWALAGSQTALFAPTITTQAYRRGEIGDIGGVSTYMSQNVPTFTGTAAQGDTPTVTNAVATNQVLYDIVKNTEGTPGIWGPATGGAGTGLELVARQHGGMDQHRSNRCTRHWRGSQPASSPGNCARARQWCRCGCSRRDPSHRA
jgi:hypothetical protein